MATPEVRIGRLTLRPRRELFGEAGPVAIGGRALDLLSALAARGGALVSKDELLEDVWPGAIVEDNALQAQISAVRKALGGEAARLVTVHGRGYRLTVEDTPESVVRAPADAGSVAVLPFANLTGAPDKCYLADGMAEELIGTLARVPGLKVPSRTSSFAYRGRDLDARTIARELGVATIVEGSLRAAGERLRVTVQLIDAANGFHLWAQNFDRTLTDLLAVQDELAHAIAAALQRELGPQPRATDSAEAMRLVLEARAATRSLTSDGMREAVRLARAALDHDPNFAKAWESLAGSTLVISDWGFGPREGFAAAREYAERAIALDPGLSGANAIVAVLDAGSGRLNACEERMRLAIRLSPYDPLVKENAVLALHLPTGMIGKAAGLAQESATSSPPRAVGLLLCACCDLARGNLEAAERAYRQGIQLRQVTAPWLTDCIEAEIACQQGDFAAASAPLTRLLERELALPEAGPTVEAVLAARAGAADSFEAGERAMALFEAARRTGSLWNHTANAGVIIRLLVQLGQLDAAFAAARRVVEHWRSSGRLLIGSLFPLWGFDMAAFRADPRFHELMSELGLYAFWAVHGPPDGHRIEDGRLIAV